MREYDGWLSETRETLRVGLPIVAAQVVQMSMGVVDTIMAGNLSARDLAAVAVGGSLYVPLFLLVMGTLMAINPVVAHLHGAHKKAEIGTYLWQALWLSQLLAIPIFVAYRHMDFLFDVFHIKPAIVPVAGGYLRALGFGLPAAFGYFCLRFFHEGLRVSKPGMFFALVGLVVNVVGNYLFMYGHLGFPALGAVGTGWATALVQWVMFACMIAFTFRKGNALSASIRAGLQRPRWRFQKEILRVGVPNGLSICIEVSLFALVALLMGSLGVKTVAAHQVTINFASFTFMIPLGLSFATTARVGFAAGKGRLDEARMLGYVGVGLSVVFMSLTACLMMFAPEVIVLLYSRDLAVKEIAVKLLFLAGIFQISDGLQVAGFGALRGLKDTAIPMLVNIVAYWLVGLPLGYYLGLVRGVGAPGLWMGLIAGLTVAALLHNVRFHLLTRGARRGRGQEKLAVAEAEPIPSQTQ